jgi:hypothetical protein
VRENLNVVLIWISFVARDVEHFFMCFLTICTSSFKELCLVHLLILKIGSLIL